MGSYKKQNLIYFALARTTALIGSRIQLVATPLFILDKTGSGALMGLFMVLSMVPSFLVTPISGSIGDRYNRKKIMVFMDIGRSVISCIMAAVAFFGTLDIAILFSSLVFISMMDGFFNSASESIFPDLVSSENLSKGNAVKNSSDCISMIAGPVLGGIVYGFFGMKAAILINGLTFLASSIFTMLISYNHTSIAKGKLSIKSLYHETNEIVRFILGQKKVLSLLGLTMVVNLLTLPILFIILPFAFRKVIGFSAQQYGYLEMILMVGLLIGSISVGTVFAKVQLPKILKGGLLASAVLVVLFSYVFHSSLINYFGANWYYFCINSLFLITIGFFNPLISIPVQTIIQKIVPSENRSRFFAIFLMLTQLAIPISSLIYGFLLDFIPVYILILGVGIVFLVFSLAYLYTTKSETYELNILTDA